MKLEESADPKVQLEQAIREARDQHRKLTEQAANVIANQKQTQLKLDRAIEEYEKANASARQALLLSDQEARAGNADKAGSFGSARGGVREQDHQPREADRRPEEAAARRDAPRRRRRSRPSRRTRPHCRRSSPSGRSSCRQLDQAKMQEQMNKAMTQLSETVGDEVPTFEEVRNKIEKRLAKAQASTELTGTGVESQMLEVEQAQASAEAQARLSELRSELGLSTPPPPQKEEDRARPRKPRPRARSGRALGGAQVAVP